MSSMILMTLTNLGKTLLLDDFDIHRYLLRRSASEWEWIRKFFYEIVLSQIDKVGQIMIRSDKVMSGLSGDLI